MSSIKELKKILKEIDFILDSYKTSKLTDERVIKDIFKERAEQRPILEKVITKCNAGLKKYPFNIEFLRRRAFASSLIVTSKGNYPKLNQAEKDLRNILEIEPNHLTAGLELLELIFTFSGMEDKDVAEKAAVLSKKAQNIFLGYLALQIKALAYADSITKAKNLYNMWIKIFPDSKDLKGANKSIESLK